SECVPFSRIPHASQLFRDFLHNFDKVKQFYARPPFVDDWWREEIKTIDYPAGRRTAVADILERQNRDFGAGANTLANLKRLREGAAAVVTGQQAGLFGGPLFCLLKALAVALAAEKTGAVPVFWVATEDHDLAEVNSVSLPDTDHLKKFSVDVAHVEGAPVGSIAFDDEITAAAAQVEGLFGVSEISEHLRAAYRKGETFGSAFAKFYSRVLDDLGIIFLDPLDPELHRITQPLYRSALEKSELINQELLLRNHQLESKGYHAQVKITGPQTLCFYFGDGVRTPIRHDGDGFLIGARKLSRSEILAETERCPERFSANVLLRPVVQDYLLPTLCYIGGPAEIAYFAQIETVYSQLATRVTPVIPRLFATLVESRQAKLLERYGLSLADIFVDPEKLKETIAGRALPQSLMQSFDSASDHLEQALSTIHEPLEKLDRTLADAAENAGSKMRYQLQGLRDKAARAEARKNGELQRHAEELSTLLYPNKELQEREIGTLYFLLKYGKGLVQKLKESVRSDCPAHQVISI
ncbi:MAG: bacillithiol biosynthesis cysteine-adding enzyme BshC, partial [Candidatus Angelobacter sp.]